MKLNIIGEEVTLSKKGEKMMREALEDVKANRVEPKMSPEVLESFKQKIKKMSNPHANKRKP